MHELRTPASDRSGVPPFHVMRVYGAAVRRRATGAPVYDLTAGQPSTPAPAAVLAQAHRSLESDIIGYTSSVGIPPLRAAIAQHYRDRYKIDVAPDDVLVTTGSSGAFILAFLAAFSAGDVVALPRPGYPAYRNTLAALGCEVLELPCDASTRYQPTVGMLEALNPRPAGLVLASPANPTGTMVDPDDLAAIATWCETNSVRLISDEIYHGISYTTTPSSAWHTSRQAIVINSFSKYFAMTGWRLGWLLSPPELFDAMDRLTGNLSLCPPTLAQQAAVRAFDDYDELDARVDGYRRNRSVLLDGLARLGLTRRAPADGAFYAYVDVSDYCTDSMDFVYRMLEQTGVAAAPGIDFDLLDGHRFIRFSFAGAEETIRGALDALAQWLPAQRLD